MKNITILGATGSIGTSTLRVVDLNKDKFSVFGVSANTSVEKMAILCQKYQPQYAVMADEKSAKNLSKLTKSKVLSGDDGLNFIASCSDVDMVMCGIVGAKGMLSTIAAAKNGKKILLANKESLVLAGEILIKTVKENNAQIIPVDSEHSAIFQALCGGRSGLKKLQLTASGGPFFQTPLNNLKDITPKQASSHPRWSMGAKISVDSATMMNKGLEVIEAHYLFGVDANKIEVIIHPQSIIHSSVYYNDGSVISQLGNPDMRTAIAYAMAHPKRIKSGVNNLDLTQHKLEFFKPDLNKFPCLSLAFDVLRRGAGSIGALNASNEVFVEAFLQKKIRFMDIYRLINENLNQLQNSAIKNLDDVIANDNLARIKARELL